MDEMVEEKQSTVRCTVFVVVGVFFFYGLDGLLLSFQEFCITLVYILTFKIFLKPRLSDYTNMKKYCISFKYFGFKHSEP